MKQQQQRLIYREKHAQDMPAILRTLAIVGIAAAIVRLVSAGEDLHSFGFFRAVGATVPTLTAIGTGHIIMDMVGNVLLGVMLLCACIGLLQGSPLATAMIALTERGALIFYFAIWVIRVVELSRASFFRMGVQYHAYRYALATREQMSLMLFPMLAIAIVKMFDRVDAPPAETTDVDVSLPNDGQ